MELYGKLIGATETIVKQFGRGIVLEKRFVNILSDLYPERDNPALFRIIKSAIQDDLLKNVLNSNIKSIEHQVATATLTLTKQYGYDKTLVENTLYSLAIGHGTISTAQYNALKALQNKPTKKKVSPPTQKNNPNPTKPLNNNKNSNLNTQNTQGDKAPIPQIVFLVIAFLGILFSPYFYASLLCNANNWPTSATVFVALMQLLTVFPISVALVSYFQDTGKPINTKILGAYVALHFFAIAFWILFPFFFGIEDVQYYFEFETNDEAFPTGAIFFNAFCAYFMYARIAETFKVCSINNLSGYKKLSDQLKYCFGLKPFKDGFKLIVSLFLIIGLFIVIYPLIPHKTWRKIENFDMRIESINKEKEALRIERSKKDLELSFAQYKLGDSYSSCLNKISKTEEVDTTSTKLLSVDEIDYDSIIDSVIIVKSQWNNEDIKIGLFFSNSTLFAISFNCRETPADSIIAIYSAKYGEPEYHLETYYEKYGSSVDKKTFYKSSNRRHLELYPSPDSSPHNCFWTYKNSLINIYRRFNIETTVTYLDRKIELIQKSKKQENERLIQAAEKRHADSLQRVQEEEERLEKERQRLEQLEREKNHKKSIEQI